MGLKIRGLRRMFRFDGYRVDRVIFSEDIVQVNLLFDRRRKFRCPNCRSVMGCNRTTSHMVHDLPFGLARHVVLCYPARQGRCRQCGTVATIHPPGIDSRRRATDRLMRLATALSVHMPATSAACFIPVSDSTLRRWDKHVLNDLLPPPDLDGLGFLMVDEKSIGKGHKYVTIVLDGDTGDLLHIAEGRRKASLEAFFDKLSNEQKSHIQAVCVDRAGAYLACIEEQLPDAEIVYDKFHLMQNLNHAVDMVRRQEWNAVRQKPDNETQEQAKQRKQNATFIKGQRYNLLRRPEKNTPEQQTRLDELLQLNESLNKAYILLDDFRDAIGQPHAGNAQRTLKTWIKTAVTSGLQPIAKFARRLAKDLRRVVNAIRFGLNNGKIEGFNNLVSRVIHKACGLHDPEYLQLKLRHQAIKTPIPPYLPHPQK